MPTYRKTDDFIRTCRRMTADGSVPLFLKLGGYIVLLVALGASCSFARNDSSSGKFTLQIKRREVTKAMRASSQERMRTAARTAGLASSSTTSVSLNSEMACVALRLTGPSIPAKEGVPNCSARRRAELWAGFYPLDRESIEVTLSAPMGKNLVLTVVGMQSYVGQSRNCPEIHSVLNRIARSKRSKSFGTPLEVGSAQFDLLNDSTVSVSLRGSGAGTPELTCSEGGVGDADDGDAVTSAVAASGSGTGIWEQGKWDEGIWGD